MSDINYVLAIALAAAIVYILKLREDAIGTEAYVEGVLSAMEQIVGPIKIMYDDTVSNGTIVKDPLQDSQKGKEDDTKD